MTNVVVKMYIALQLELIVATETAFWRYCRWKEQEHTETEVFIQNEIKDWVTFNINSTHTSSSNRH
jgi:hypothetical protein